ncbi:MAG: hypothetical protein KAQ84_00405 [Thermoplasmatales archaeon]|nr:hypothetical protein [Thermoplasmatales archaeon]
MEHTEIIGFGVTQDSDIQASDNKEYDIIPGKDDIILNNIIIFLIIAIV